MQPSAFLDRLAFAIVVAGALAWGGHASGVNVIEALLAPLWSPLDEIAYTLIGMAGVYRLVRALAQSGGDGLAP